MGQSVSSSIKRALALGALATGVIWLVWRALETRAGVPAGLFWLVWGLEAAVLCRLAMLALAERRPSAGDQPLFGPAPTIDVAILVENESPAMVRAALVAAGDVVGAAEVLLVAPADAGLDALAAEFEARLVPADGTREGAIVAAGSATTADAVALVGAGSIPLHDLVRISVRELIDPSVAVVQSVREDADCQPVLWTGSGSVVRTSVLRSVDLSFGLFAVTVELATSGRRIVASSRSIVASQSPETALARQNRRVVAAADRIRVFATGRDPLLAPGPGLRIRAALSSALFDDLAGFAAALWMFALTVSILVGQLPFDMTAVEALALGLPTYVLAALTRWAVSDGRLTPGVLGAQAIDRLDAGVRAVARLMSGRLDRANSTSGPVQPVATGLILALNLAVVLRAVSSIGPDLLPPADRATTVVSLGFGLITLIPALRGLSVLLTASSQRRGANRAVVALAGEVDGRSVRILDLGPGGVSLALSTVDGQQIADAITVGLLLPHIGLIELPGAVRSSRVEDSFRIIGLEFTDPGTPDHDLMVGFWARSWADEATAPSPVAVGSGRRVRLPVVDRGRHRVVRLVTCVGLLATGMAALVPVSAAGAAPLPNSLVLSKQAPASVLYGAPSTVTLTAASTWSTTNPSPERYYNASFRDVLPVGVGYVAGSANPAPDRVLTDSPVAGQTTLIWTNVNDILPGSNQSITYSVTHNTSGTDTGPIKVGDTFTNSAGVYANTNPRFVPKFSVSGVPVVGANSFTDSGTSAATTLVVPVQITKSEPSPESELMRGVHDHATIYTLTLRNNSIAPTMATAVDDYLPAGLEFLGCGTADNTPGGAVEYPGAPRLDVSTGDLTTDCPAPVSVETVSLDPDGAGPLAAGVSTHVRWNTGTLTANQTKTIRYRAGIPNRANVVFPAGSTPAVICGPAVDSCGQVANLSNNTGAPTTETAVEQSLVNGAAIAGTYSGRLGGSVTPTQTWHRTTHTVTSEDVAVQKTGCNSTPPNPQAPTTGACLNGITTGGSTRWTLNIRTSEYRSAAGATLVDSLPDGLAYTPGSASISLGGGAATPFEPTLSAIGGVQRLTWGINGLPRSGVSKVTFDSTTLANYQVTGRPVLSFDTLTNRAAIDATTSVVLGDDDTGDQVVSDVSEATLTSGWSRLDKSTLSGAAAASTVVSSGGTNYQCASGSSVPVSGVEVNVPRFAPDDVVCFDLRVDFPVGISVGNVVIADFLPANTSYLGYSRLAGHTADEVVTSTGPYGAGEPVVWAFGAPSGATPRFSEPGSSFHVVIAARISDDPAANNNFDIVANLLKVTAVDTAGGAVSIRDLSTYFVARPELQLVKGVTDVVRGASSVAGFPKEPVAGNDTSTVVQGDRVTYRVDVANVGPQFVNNDQVSDARTVTVWDNLPAGLSCANLSGSVPTSATLVRQPAAVALPVAPTVTLSSVACSANRISFTANVIPAGYTLQYRYTLVVPDSAAAGASYTNTAGVRDYRDIGGGTPYYPTTNIDPSVTPNARAASDQATVRLPAATIAKSRSTSITESSNNAADQATIGEQVNFSVRVVVPAKTTLYNAVVADPLPSGFAYVAKSAAVSSTPIGAYDPTTFTLADTANGWTLSFPATYRNADSTDHVVTVTARGVVKDIAANAHGTRIRNTARLTWNESLGGKKLGDTTSTATTNVVEPDPRITKVHSPAGPFAGGDQVVYSVTVSNPAGRPPLHEPVITDCVPVGLGAVTPTGTRLAVVGSGAPCATGQTRLTWTLTAPLQPGESIVLTYTARLNTPAVASAELINTATVTGSSIAGAVPGERTTYRATVNDTIVIKPMAITKSVNPDIRVPGQQSTFTLAVTLPANLVAYDAAIIDTLPAKLAFDQFGPFGPANFSAGCVRSGTAPHTIAPTGQRAGWFLGDLRSGTTDCVITITYTAHVRSAAVSGDQLSNSAVLLWNRTDRRDDVEDLDGTGFDASRTATAKITVVEPKLTLDKTVGSPTRIVQGGEALTYTLTVRNTGTAPAFDITTTDVVPVGLGTPTAFGGTCVGATAATWAPGSRTITWSSLFDGPPGIVGLAPAATCTLTSAVVVDSAAADPSTWSDGSALKNTADIGTFFGDPTHDGPDFKSYDGPSDTETVTPYGPRLAITKTTADGAELGQAVLGRPFGWTLTVTNTSKYATSYGVDVSDELPENWTYTATTSITPTACSKAPSVAGSPAQIVTWSNLCDLGPGGTIVIRFTATPQLAAAVTPGLVDGDGLSVPHLNEATATGSDLGGNQLPPVSDDAAATIRSVDLQILKSGPAGFTVGVPGSYSLDVKNNGPDPETGPIVVVDDLPAGLTATSVDSADAAWDCAITGAGRRITCRHPGPLAANANLDRLTIAVDVGLAALNIDSTTGRVTNIATVSGTDTDRRPDNNSDEVETPVQRISDFTIDKLLDPTTPFVPGQQVRYLVTARYLGPSPAVGPLTITDPLPTRLRLVSAVGAGWDCSASVAGTGFVSCVRTVNELPRDTSLDSVIVTAQIDPATPVSPPVVNVARVTHPNDDNPSNDTNDETANPDPKARLTIDKSDGDATFAVGQTDARYYVTVANLGPSTEVGPVVVTDIPPAGLALRSVTGSGWSCQVAAGFRCTWIGDDAGADPVPPGVTLPQLTMTVDVLASAVQDPAPGAENTVTNVARVVGVTDPEPREDDETTPVVPTAALTIDKRHDPATEPWQVGGRGVFEIEVANAGPSGEYGPVTVTDPLPAGLTYVSATGEGWLCEFDSIVRCTADVRLPAGTSLPVITVTVDVGADAAPNLAPEPNVVTNTATVNGTTDPVSHSDTDVVPVNPIADLSIVKTHEGDTFTVGSPATFTLVVKNSGPNGSAGPITVTDPLPAGLTFASGLGIGWTCSAPPDGLDVSCLHAGALAVDEESTITLLVNVGPAAYGDEPHEVKNTATVRGTTTDPNPENDRSTDTVLVAPLVDLAIDKSHTGDFVVSEQGTFSLVVTNLGPNPHPTADITVVDELPNGLNFVSASGNGWTCSAAGQLVTCLHPGPVAVGAALPTISVTVDVTAVADGGVTNVVTVSTPVAESTTANNTDSDPVVIIPNVNLVLTKRLQGQLVPGDVVRYVVTVRNDGPSAAEPPTVTDELPAQLEAVAALGDGFTCTVTPQRVVCVRSSKLPAGASAEVAVEARVRDDASGEVTNTARVSTPAVETSTTDNVAVAVAGVTQDRPGTGSSGGSGSGSLAFTGADAFRYLVAAMALLLGGFLLLAGSKRRRQSS